jgi:hypothetical protein
VFGRATPDLLWALDRALSSSAFTSKVPSEGSRASGGRSLFPDGQREQTVGVQLVEGGDMKPRTAQEERRSGIRWLIAGAFVLAAAFAGWWLVATTNREGTHDAELLPLFALIPLLIGLYHLVRARLHQV